MPNEQFTIVFEGYWLHDRRNAIPARSGVFCVYSCQPKKCRKRVEARRLLYIGCAEDVRAEVDASEQIHDWLALLQPGETLCYAYGGVNPDQLRRCAAALVFRHKPPANDSYVYRFPFQSTMVNTRGATAMLCARFTAIPA